MVTDRFDQLDVIAVTHTRPTRRGFITAALGAPLLVAVGVALSARSSGSRRVPLSPLGAPVTNLVENPSFELDVMGTTFTSWVVGVPLALPVPEDSNTEGIPATQ